MNVNALFPRLACALLVFAALSLARPAAALEAAGLYQGTAPVESQAATARPPAIRAAFIEALIKLTGDRNIAQHENIAALAGEAGRYVQQFRYQQAEPGEAEAAPRLTLWVKFDEQAVNQALRDYGLSVWPRERPAILVWLAYEENGRRRLAEPEDASGLLALLEQHAARRGLPLLAPLFDLEDAAALPVSDVWAGFKAPVMAASGRYRPDIVLTGRLFEAAPGRWELQWRGWFGAEALRWNNNGAPAGAVLRAGVDELADRLAARYVKRGSAAVERIRLTVRDVASIDDYARTLAHLEALQSVLSVEVKRVRPNELALELNARGGLAAIEQALGLGGALEAIEAMAPGGPAGYRLLPR